MNIAARKTVELSDDDQPLMVKVAAAKAAKSFASKTVKPEALKKSTTKLNGSDSDTAAKRPGE